MWRKSASTWRRPAGITGPAGSATTAGCAAMRPTAWRVEGPFHPAASLAEGDPGAGDREDSLAAEALPLRPGQDRDVSGPLPRRDPLHLRGVADLETARHEPAARLAALPTPSLAVETV